MEKTAAATPDPLSNDLRYLSVPADDVSDSQQSDVHSSRALLDAAARGQFQALPSSFRALTAARRSFVLQQPIVRPKTVVPFHRALRRLRGVQLWMKMLEEIKTYGTGSGLFDQYRTYKQCLPDVMHQKRRANPATGDEVAIPVPLGYLFHPDSKFKQCWSVLILFLLLYSFLFVPYLIAFVDTRTFWDEVDTTVDVLFLCDILFTLNTAVADHSGRMVTSRWEIFKLYLQGMLLLDILSIFPFDYLNINSGGANNLVRFIRLAKFSRLVRASKMIKLINYLSGSESMKRCSEFLKVYSGVARLITALYMVIILVHLASCMWYFSAKLGDFEPDSWVVRKGLLDASDFTLYMTSFYWAITTLTTVGFGDISARTTVEMMICMVWMMFGVGFYSFIVGTLSSLLTSLDAKSSMLNEKLQVVELFAKDTHLREDIVKRISKEVKDSAETVTLDEAQRQSLISQLSKPLRLQLARRMFHNAAQRIVFFTEIDKACLTFIVPLLTQRNVTAGKFLYEKGDYADEVYFVLTGRLACVYGKRNTAFKTIVTGAYCGEIELIHLIPREFSLMTEQDCELLVMTKSLFDNMMEQFPTVAKKVRATAEIRREKNKQCLKEVLDVLEAVEIRHYTTLHALAGQGKVNYDDSPPAKAAAESAITSLLDTHSELEVAQLMQQEMASLTRELTVSSMQEIQQLTEQAMVALATE